MFEKEGRTEMLKMCEDCRVGAMFKENDKLLDTKDRPKPRTTDDYLNQEELDKGKLVKIF